MSSLQHHFNRSIAKKFGIHIAVFLDQMVYWTDRNRANHHNFHDGAYWSRNTIEAFCIIFDYFSIDQMRKVISDCLKYGLINTGNYNKRAADRTAWYSLTDYAAELLRIDISPINQSNAQENQSKSLIPDMWEKSQMEVGKIPNESGKNPAAIPITNGNTTKSKIKNICATESIAQTRFDEFWSVYPRKKDKKRAKTLWVKESLDNKSEQIINDVKERLRNDAGWKEEKYIPHPSTYLKFERWTDEVTLVSVKKNEKFNPAQHTIDQLKSNPLAAKEAAKCF